MKKILSGIDCNCLGIKFITVLVKKIRKLFHLSGKTMGTTYHIRYIDDGSVKETC